MSKRIIITVLASVLAVTVLLILLAGCSSNADETEMTEMNSGTYQQISQDEAKSIMDSQSGYIIVDAREQYEYDEGHIKDAIVIPYTEIEAKAEKMLPDKEQLILVYCRSGRRSKIAAQSLADMGYTNVKEFGGIIDWQYDIVK